MVTNYSETEPVRPDAPPVQPPNHRQQQEHDGSDHPQNRDGYNRGRPVDVPVTSDALRFDAE